MQRIKRIVIASKNPGKLGEFERLFGRDSGIKLVIDERFVPPDEVEPTYHGNATLKAIAAATQFSMHALGEDSGIEIEALNWMPGSLSARFAALPLELKAKLLNGTAPDLLRLAARMQISASPTAEENNEFILQLLKALPTRDTFPFEARYVSHLALADPSGHIIARVEGSAYGLIQERPAGTGGFGHDTIMSLRPYLDRTAAQLTPAEKDAVSHRGQAVRLLLKQLQLSP
jgi:XTP/dITP diphosphohydrolase